MCLFDWSMFFRAVVLFLVYAVERNVYDQRSLEYHICDNHVEVRVIRRTLQQVRTGGFLSPTKQLIVLVSSVHFALSVHLSGDFCPMYKSL